MEKVISINDWWDGPLLGLAYYNGVMCIYERVFIEDEYINEYILTPISKKEEISVMCEWQEWCNAVSSNELDSYYKSHLNTEKKIYNIIKHPTQNIKYRKKARFKGTFKNGYIPIDYHVEWFD